MPWTKSYDKQSDTVIFTATGVLTEEEFIAGVLAVRMDPQQTARRRRFWDFAHVDRFEFTNETENRLNVPGSCTGAGARCAVLIYHPEGAARCRAVLQQICASNCRLFLDRHEVVAWLNDGVPPEKHLTVAATRLAMPDPPQGEIS